MRLMQIGYERYKSIFTSNINGLKSKGFILIGNQGGLFCLVGGVRKRLDWPRIWTVRTTSS